MFPQVDDRLFWLLVHILRQDVAKTKRGIPGFDMRNAQDRSRQCWYLLGVKHGYLYRKLDSR